MSRHSQILRTIAVCVVVIWAGCWNALSARAEPTGEQWALLVGCSDYEFLPGRNLRGPKNDVRQFADTLKTRFGFAPNHIRQLVGKPADPKLCPTRENILRELDELAKVATPGTQIVIAFSGHGTRVPLPEGQDPFDPKNPEPDGYDEAFVAADAKQVNGEMQNLILDNELGVKLQAMRDKGARVWALFDCCHSGSLSRAAGEDDSGEVSRELTATDLELPRAKIDQADALDRKNRVAQETTATKAMSLIDVSNDLQHKSSSEGSLVAFYAAQPFETAPDLPCPQNAPKVDENYYGLLTYTTLQTLLRQQSEHKLTYRELGQTIIGRYRAERGTRGPTPNFEGDLDREVLGLQTWPGRSKMLLQKQGTNWGINAGQLQGLTVGSIVAVYPPATASVQDKTPTGYVRVKNSTSIAAEIEPCAYEKSPALAVSKLQEAMRCEIVQRQWGEMRLQVQLVKPDPAYAAVVQDLREELGKASKTFSEYLQLTDSPSAAWQLRVVTPNQAREDFNLDIRDAALLLIRSGESVATSTRPVAEKVRPAGRVWRQYELRDVAALQLELQSDLQKIFTWQNLWQVAGGMGIELGGSQDNLKLELALLSGLEDKSGGKLLDQAQLKNGDILELRLSNVGAEKMWATLVFMDSNFRITVYTTQQLQTAGSDGCDLQPIRFEVATKTPGPQSWLVIASSAEANRQEPDYQFLTQTGLSQKLKEPVVASRAAGSPFESLALAVAGQKGGFRGEITPAPQNPVLLLRTWVVVPSSSPKGQ
jgi:hypothetical protein